MNSPGFNIFGIPLADVGDPPALPSVRSVVEGISKLQSVAEVVRSAKTAFLEGGQSMFEFVLAHAGVGLDVIFDKLRETPLRPIVERLLNKESFNIDDITELVSTASQLFDGGDDGTA